MSEAKTEVEAATGSRGGDRSTSGDWTPGDRSMSMLTQYVRLVVE